MQQTTELWLILELTGSGTALGLHAVLRSGPVLLFGAHGGLVSDRYDRLKLMIATQASLVLATGWLAIVSWWSIPTLIMIYAVVLAQGLVNALDNPVRRSFIRDLVDDVELSNAIGLHSTVATLSRTVGPAIAGLLIATVGVKWCFTINVLSYAAVLVSLLRIDRRLLRPFQPVGRAPRQLRDGFRYAWNNPLIRTTLILVIVVSTFAWNWNILLPGYASSVFNGDASLYGLMVALLSAGSFVGALGIARLLRIGGRHLLIAGAALSGSLAVVASAPNLLVAFIGLVILGMSGTAFTVGAQARLQLNIDGQMSGRVMALYSVGFVGSKPLGGLLGGGIMDAVGPRFAFGTGGLVVALVVAVLALRARWGHEESGR